MNRKLKELKQIFKQYQSKYFDSEPDYIKYLILKEFMEGNSLIYLRNDYKLYTSKEMMFLLLLI